MVTAGDMHPDHYWACVEAGISAWDIETSGLDWKTDQIGTCQVATPLGINVVVLGGSEQPKRLADVLENPDVRKVFHHAPFDLRFLIRSWHARPMNVACTKIASKIANPDLEPDQHSLKPVLDRHLGIRISKQQQVSDWLAPGLTEEQIEYAATDVAHLVRLYGLLLATCERQGVADVLEASWDYLPSRAALDILGAGDVFTY